VSFVVISPIEKWLWR